MGLWAAIKLGWTAARIIRQFRAEVESRGAVRLSPAAGTRDRRRLELLVLDLIDHKDTGVLRLTKLDSGLAGYLASLLKSGNLNAVLNAGSTLERTEARRRIFDGAMDAITPDDLANWSGPAGDRGKP